MPSKNATATVKAPALNGRRIFYAGWLDQSFWPDGLYAAASDDALAFDLRAAKEFGLNMIRLHQKVNPERWYYYADTLGLAIFQDVPQKYGHASNATIPLFDADLAALISGPRANHPSIVMWDVFNEKDCVGVVAPDAAAAQRYVDTARALDAGAGRMIDTNSGGPANDYGVGDVNDVHTYPNPGDPAPSASQWAMIGEYGGLGAFQTPEPGHEWVPGACNTYKQVNTSQEFADTYVEYVRTVGAELDDVSAIVYTQPTDLERECDGFLNYDRSARFSDHEKLQIQMANAAIIAAGSG